MKKRNISNNQIIDIKERWGLFLVENYLNKLEEQENLQQFNSNNSEIGQNTSKVNIQIVKNGFDKNYQIIQQRFVYFIKEIFYNNKEYEYINPFIIIIDLEEKNFVKVEKMYILYL